MDIQKMIDDAVEEFRKKLEAEFKEPELTSTQFECIDNNGELFVADAKELNTHHRWRLGGVTYPRYVRAGAVDYIHWRDIHSLTVR